MKLPDALLNNKDSLTLSNQWEFYITTMDNYTTGIRVDIGAIQDERFSHLIHTWTLSVSYRDCYENGLPQPAETQRLNGVEDWLEEKGRELPIWLVGVVTQNGWRDFVFMSEKEVVWETTVNRLLIEGPEVSYRYDHFLNDNGEYYKQYLYPTKYDWNWIHDSRVCRSLQEQGDELTEPREIDHYAILPDEKSAQAFALDVAALPYSIKLQSIRANEQNNGFTAAFLSKDIPQRWHMTEITNQLTDMAEKHGGSYDGWGTTVQKS